MLRYTLERIKGIKTILEGSRWRAVYKPGGMSWVKFAEAVECEEEKMHMPLRLGKEMQGIVLVGKDGGIGAQFTRMLQKGEIERSYRIWVKGEGKFAVTENLEEVKQKVKEGAMDGVEGQLWRVKFRDPMGSMDELNIEVGVPPEWGKVEEGN